MATSDGSDGEGTGVVEETPTESWVDTEADSDSAGGRAVTEIEEITAISDCT